MSTNSNGEAPFQAVTTLLITDIIPNNDGVLTFEDPDADAVVGVFVQDVENNLSLVDCITATKSRFVKYEF